MNNSDLCIPSVMKITEGMQITNYIVNKYK